MIIVCFLGYIAKNKSFYASLHAQQSIIQSQENLYAELSNALVTEWR